MQLVEKKPRPRKAPTAPPAEPSAKTLPNVRRLKISTFIYLRPSRGFFDKRTSSHLPYLRLCGRWLERAGFLSDQYVNITVSENKLIIERETN